MATITEAELLSEVKKALGIGGNYQDDTLTIYIDETKEYLKSAGISEDTLKDRKCIGVISRGVADLWNYGSGNAQWSLYFMQRVAQLVCEEKKKYKSWRL